MAGLSRTLLGLLALSSVVAQTPPPPDVVLRFDVNLVQVDALVTDSRGNHIPGLKAQDFEVLQDGKPQKITHFDYVATESHHVSAKPWESAPRLPVPPPTKAEVRRTIVFMLDDANMSFADFHYAQEALRRYIDEEVRPTDMVAVARTSYGSGALQIFTSDARWLHTALERMIWRPPLPYISAPLISSLMRAVRALAQYPGRKSIVLISPGLPPGQPGQGASDRGELMRQIADAANRASVTIETVDCRGLVAPTGMSPRMQRSYDYFGSQDILDFLAAMTAGRFQHLNNDIAGLVRDAADDGDGYYLIGWYPGSDAFKTKPNRPMDYHRVKIRLLSGKGLSVRTRNGFYAYPGDNVKVAYNAAQKMNEALFSPFRSGDIDVRLTASLGYDQQDGAYIDSLLQIRPTGVDFHDVPGRPDCKLADLEVLTAPEPLDPDKVPTGRIDGQHAQIQVCKKLDGLLRDGLVVSVRNQIPVPGPYQMRVAVRNMEAGDRPSIGPDAAKGLIQRGSLTPDHTPIGSANQIIEVPDTRKQDMVLTGITLQSGVFLEPIVNGGASYRVASADDPGVRQFHPGETLTYSFRLLRSTKKSADPAEVRVRILRDDKEIYLSQPRSVKPGDPVTGNYTLDASAEAGHYVLGVSAGPATQWIDFEVK
jgi:VWFA-related protein